MVSPMTTSVELLVPEPDAGRLARGEHHDPHSILGAHPTPGGVRVVAFHPDAVEAEIRAGTERVAPHGVDRQRPVGRLRHVARARRIPIG